MQKKQGHQHSYGGNQDKKMLARTRVEQDLTSKQYIILFTETEVFINRMSL
jgi:hypothetical protein